MTKEQFMNEKLLLYSAEQVAARDEAWARLVKAERAHIGGAALGDAAGSLREYEAAKLALRVLGVDVDALLGDGR